MLICEDNIVYSIEGDQDKYIKLLVGCRQKLVSQKQVHDLPLNESVGIIFTWQKFDSAVETWLDDPTNNDPIKLDIDGVKEELQPVNGTDTLVFSSAEPGLVTIKTENPYVDNVILEVTVSA